MNSFKTYKTVLLEEFNKEKAVKDALQWMKNKYGEDLYTFKHIENLDMNGTKVKTYDINVGEESYKLNLRKFDSNGDGESDTLGFDVETIALDPEENEEEEL